MDLVTCPTCGGPATLLGFLGNLIHLRCRDCGWDFSQPVLTSADFDPEPDQGNDDDHAVQTLR